MIGIQNVWTNFEIEPLLRPFAFKGGSIKDIWQSVVALQNSSGFIATGIGCQGVLWSDASVFSENTPSTSSAMMYLITAYSAQLLKEQSYQSPFEAMDFILPKAMDYARNITHHNNLRKTFVLNSLVPLDLALWKLYEDSKGRKGFDSIIPENIKPIMSHRYDRIQCIPLISYGVTSNEIYMLAKEGFFILKIKIGSNPEGDNDPKKMLDWDKNRLLEVHTAVKNIRTPYTHNGHIAYYLDANGRYDTKERLLDLLDYANEIGMLDRIVLLEEPFEEDNKQSVHDLPVCVAADERAHSVTDVAECISLGYGAIALKPIAKTLTETFLMIEEAMQHNIPCFCADLTVGPLQLEVNKSVAARLPCLPSLKLPVVESNGWQNYSNWDIMRTYSPSYKETYSILSSGGFSLNTKFYTDSAGIFLDSEHYRNLAMK